jgi:hypothetical protein
LAAILLMQFQAFPVAFENHGAGTLLFLSLAAKDVNY